MSMRWQSVQLGEVIKQRKQFITIDDAVMYCRPTVKLHAQGILLRDRVLGASIKTKKQQVCRADEFLVAEIDAKAGGFGIVPKDLDGSLVSSHYFLYQLDSTLLLPKFLELVVKTNEFRRQVEAQGTTNYAAIKAGDVYGYAIPLPALAVQKQIVSKIDAADSKLRDVARLRGAVTNELNMLCRNLVIRDSTTKHIKISELVKHKSPDVTVTPDEVYQFAGVYSFGRGVFKGVSKTGAEFAYTKLSRISTGNFIYPKLMAWEGALGVVPDECDNCVVSPEFPVFEIDKEQVLPDVFDVYFRDPNTWDHLQTGSTGTNARRRRLNPKDFLQLTIPVPSMAVQRKLAAIRLHQAKIRSISPEAECSALISSILSKLLTS
ncbi:MAG: hypothetical protein RL211_1334 [Pseudomonadota bacterium]|jgi:type I restriction enzyme S subunit